MFLIVSYLAVFTILALMALSGPFGAGFSCALFLGSLADYWVHRAMRWGLIKRKVHVEHHKNAFAKGFLAELRGYVLPGGLIIYLAGYLICHLLLGSSSAGVGWVVGGLAFVVFAAYSHQLQHERPERCFWMRVPLHHVHHAWNMVEKNFGISTDFWDRVFGTYEVSTHKGKAIVWKPEKRPFAAPLLDFFRIDWLGKAHRWSKGSSQ